MGKNFLKLLIVLLIGTSVLLFFQYKNYLNKKNDLIILKSEVNNYYIQLDDVSSNIYDLILEEEKINNEKEKQIGQYQKWVRQNQILKELLN
ncbi:MAG: hypothetical protein WDA21_03905 [Bacilli bacterium]